jgi:DMSO/TMAO reductase YedYZ heme-binding membrane subunit
MNGHLWWYLSRATGIVAWGLATASVLWGMALSTRALGPKPRAPWLLDVHRFLGGLCVLFVAGHMGSLVADSYVEFDLGDLFVPFASSWRPLAVALGVVSVYLLLAVEITSLVKRRFPKRLWRAVHLSSYGVFVLSSLHFVLAGSDAGSVVARTALIASTSSVAFFLVYLVIGPGRAASVRGARRTVPVPRTPVGNGAGAVDGPR